jgi:hypothetical protein
MRILRWPLTILAIILLFKTETGFWPLIPMLLLLNIRNVEQFPTVDWDLEALYTLE